MKIAIVGATGLVGHELLELIADQAGTAKHELGAFASATSAGQEIAYGDQKLRVEALENCDFAGFDAALFCIGDELSAEYVPQAVAAGCLVVDKSNTFRMQPDVPLVVAGVNNEAITRKSRLSANPNCSTIILTHSLNPWRQYGLQRIWVATYQSVSGAGKSGPERLATGLYNQPADGTVNPRPDWNKDEFAHNIIPAVGGIGADGRCSEESKLVLESRKIFGHNELSVFAHAARVPVFIGHSMAVTVELDQAVDETQLIAAWKSQAEYLKYCDSSWPTPLSAMHHHAAEVGRLRKEDQEGKIWSYFASGDNLTLGAALNGWRILELLVRAAGNDRAATGEN